MLTTIHYSVVFFFIATTLLALFFFLRSVAKSSMENPAKSGKRIMTFLFLWLLIQAGWGFSGFYRDYLVLPPRLFLYGVAPALVIIAILFLFSPWRKALMDLDLESLTWLHVVRIPVELGLFFLFVYKVVPKEMTFEGRNFDIISGLSAPVVAWLVFKKNNPSGRKILIAWNIISLALLINIVYIAIFSTPFPFQKFGGTQANIAVFYFPFVWLPTLIVPLVLLSHLVALAKLFSKE